MTSSTTDNARIDLSVRYEIDANIAWRKIAGEAFLITRNGKTTHRLNATATRVIELANEGKSGFEIVTDLTGEFAGAADEIRRDVIEVLDTMRTRGVLIPRGKEST